MLNFPRPVFQTLFVALFAFHPAGSAAPPPPLSQEANPQAARSKLGLVASVHPLATNAGVEAFRRGGNALDAAIATAVTLGVVDQHNSGLGGGCFILLRRADGKLFAIDGRETAPALASRDMYLEGGKAHPTKSRTGPLAVATPGALAAYALALREHGKLSLREIVLPASELAEKGFPLDRIYARNIAATAADLSQFAGSRQVFFKPDGKPFAEGDPLRQSDLAHTLRRIAEQGEDWFYRGEFAQRVSTWMEANGGLLRASDFAAYKPLPREPLVGQYRGYTIIGFPPPSSGGVHVQQMLNMLEPFSLTQQAERGPGEAEHLLAETMKRAFADRAFWLGDPAFAQVPRGLVNRDYAAKLSGTIDLTKAAAVLRHGEPPGATTDFFSGAGKHTTHIAAADAAGNWVAITQTVNTSLGSKVIVPGTGVVLNNEMDDFSIQPGQPNAFGLIGAEANAVAPGKRPLSSMSPTVVLHGDKPIFTVGAAGGPTIISQVLQALVRRIDLNLSLEQTLAGPRIHHQWRPDELRVERSLSAPARAALQKKGHTLREVDGIGVSQAIAWDEQSGEFVGLADPRVPGSAAGP